MTKKPEKKRRTLAEVKAREERLRAAGIIVERPGTSAVTLLANVVKTTRDPSAHRPD